MKAPRAALEEEYAGIQVAGTMAMLDVVLYMMIIDQYILSSLIVYVCRLWKGTHYIKLVSPLFLVRYGKNACVSAT